MSEPIPKFQCFHCKGTIAVLPIQCPGCRAIDWQPNPARYVERAASLAPVAEPIRIGPDPHEETPEESAQWVADRMVALAPVAGAPDPITDPMQREILRLTADSSVWGSHTSTAQALYGFARFVLGQAARDRVAPCTCADESCSAFCRLHGEPRYRDRVAPPRTAAQNVGWMDSEGPVTVPSGSVVPPSGAQKDSADEELVPHAFVSRTPYEPGDDRDIWCRDCEYHRDHAIHSSPLPPSTEPEAIRALIAKWRERGRTYRQFKDPSRNYDFLASANLHADELEALVRASSPPHPVRDEQSAAERCVASIAAMLGWLNVPPQRVLEAEIRALKARLKEAESLVPPPRQGRAHDERRDDE